jgi:prepilin-type N-terminal cleavage/methylation domain-containing protein
MAKTTLIRSHEGYTFIELMVALAVSSIVIAGSYAGYSLLARQQQLLNAQTSLDRNALRVVDLIQSDIRMAGYKDYQSPNIMQPSQSVVISTPADLVLVFDDYDSNNTLYRALVHYSLEPFTSAVSGLTRNRLVRDWRICNNPSIGCDLTSSTSKYSGTSKGQPILDWVTNFSVSGLSAKTSGTFLGVYQAVQIKLQVATPDKIEGTNISVSKDFNFLTRVKNVSMVP